MAEILELRCASVEDLSGGRPILVLAPHPDDETLACGALLAACFEKAGAHIVCVTDGRFSHPNSAAWPGDRLAALRERELLAAVAALGGSADDVTFLRCRDCHVPAEGADQHAIAARIAEIGERVGAVSIYASCAGDLHKDHEAVSGIGRLVAGNCPAATLYEYSVWGRWKGRRLAARDATVSHRFPAANWRERKAAALACHESQLGGVVTDDAEGFAMAPDFIAFFVENDEFFFEVQS